MCIIGVKLSDEMVFFPYKFTCRDICATDQIRHQLRIAQNDARHRLRAASLYQHHELAAFIPIFL